MAVLQYQSKTDEKLVRSAKDSLAFTSNSSKEQPSSSKKWHCEKCNKSYPNSSSYSCHKYSHKALETGRYTCQQCEKRFANSSALARHKEKACKGKTPEKPAEIDGKCFVCKECSKTFAKSHSYYQHIYRHNNVKAGKYKCEPCNMRFMDQSALRKHEQRVHKKKNKAESLEKDENGFFKCPDCDKRFEFRYKYGIHLRQHVALKQELYKCKTCELLFKTRRDLMRHEQAHENRQSRLSSDPFAMICPEATLKEEDGIFKCSACEKTFEERRVAVSHLMKHGYFRRDRIQCHLCPLTFHNKKYLEKHQAEHETQKESDSNDSTKDEDCEFKCSDCNKTFSENRLLKRHIRRHEAIKESKFPCKLCDVRCGDIKELIRHDEMHARVQQVMIVAGEKVPPIILERDNHTVYKCSDCAMIFTKQRLYFTHAQRHVNVRNGTFKCETCGMCCPTRRMLMTHLEKHRAGKSIRQRENFPFVCPECGKKFAQRFNFIQHVQRHEAVEKGTFQCKVCSKYLSSRSALITHEGLHVGQKERDV